MKIEVGKYTLGITMILCGILIFLDTIYSRHIFQDIWKYSPIVLVLFGLELIILNIIFGHKENYKVQVSVGSIFLIIIVLVIFTALTNKIEITSFNDFDNVIRIDW